MILYIRVSVAQYACEPTVHKIPALVLVGLVYYIFQCSAEKYAKRVSKEVTEKREEREDSKMPLSNIKIGRRIRIRERERAAERTALVLD